MLKSERMIFDEKKQKEVKIIDARDLFKEKYGVFPVRASRDYILNEVLRNNNNFALIHPDSAISDFLGKDIPNVEDLIRSQEKEVFLNNLRFNEDLKTEYNLEIKEDVVEDKKIVDLQSFQDTREVTYLKPEITTKNFAPVNYSTPNLPINRYSPNNYVGLRGLEYMAFENRRPLPNMGKYAYNIASKEFEINYRRAS
ncbi:MAG: hypothetical protein PF569_06275 [Candidatus Woesearchaeota archaeon]|jgi:hypothetical protein|nr:hypothetical protein [Candidatus Woesearchaeota archaeon]